MLNINKFTLRLKKILETYNETASSFAEKIGVQRSSISHILSGRNKPSLEFILKIKNTYPDIDLYWLLDDNDKQISPRINPNSLSSTKKIDSENNLFSESNNIPTTNAQKSPSSNQVSQQHANLEIENIVVLYKNGTFKYYKPE